MEIVVFESSMQLARKRGGNNDNNRHEFWIISIELR